MIFHPSELSGTTLPGFARSILTSSGLRVGKDLPLTPCVVVCVGAFTKIAECGSREIEIDGFGGMWVNQGNGIGRTPLNSSVDIFNSLLDSIDIATRLWEEGAFGTRHQILIEWVDYALDTDPYVLVPGNHWWIRILDFLQQSPYTDPSPWASRLLPPTLLEAIGDGLNGPVAEWKFKNI